jgi:hypothetical protein
MKLALIGRGFGGPPGSVLWFLAIGVALFFWLSLIGGAFYFPGGRSITERTAPRRYWTLMALLGALFIALVALGVRAFMLDSGALQ